MELFKYLGLLPCWLCIVAGDLTLFPVGKELIYEWEVEITSGTVKPTELSSTWLINATLIIQQPTEDATLFKISTISKNEDIRNEIHLPFKAVYKTGELKSLFTDKNDALWSVNLKRALVSLFQIKMESLAVPSFITSELGLYGDCKVEYASVNAEKDILMVTKIIDHDSCTNFPKEMVATTPPFLCPNNYQSITASTSDRMYTLSPTELVFIKNINATGRILVQPYQAKAESHYSRISQVIKFVHSRPIINKIEIDKSAVKKELSYEKMNLDPTFGEEPSNKTEAVEKIHSLLGEVSDTLSTWKVGVKGLDNQTSFRILDMMWWLDVEDWESLYRTVTLGTSYRQETIQHLFWELVPQVGSRASALFVKNLVMTHKVKGLLGGRLLVNFPFFLRETSEELLMQCEDLFRLGDEFPKEIRQSGILSFASLIRKTCKSQCKTDTLDRYAKLYLDKFTESTTHEDQMLYLQGLSNLELSQALDFFIPVITGHTKDNRHIRTLAMWGTLHTVFTNPNKVYEVYWPIFSNTSESLELRVTSLTLLILSNPGPARFFSIYWFMQSETSEQLYNFYFTTIYSLATTKYPCYLNLRHFATKLVRFVPPRSRHWATGNYILDFEEPERDYGGLIQMLLMASEYSGLPNIFIFMAEQHALGRSRKYALYLKVEGLDLNKELYKISEKIENGSMKMSRVIELLENLKVPLKVPERLHLELVFKVDDITLISQFINQTSFNSWANVIKRLSSLYFEFSVNYQSIYFPQMFSSWLPSDLGMPALVLMRSTALTSARGSISQENGGRARNAELDLRFSWNSVTALQIYNPFNNTWHGAERCRNLHIRLPFATQLNLHMAKSFFNATAVKHRGFLAGSRLGLVWHSSTRLVTREDVPRLYPNISHEWTIDSEDLGARLGASIFDCSHPDTLPDALHLLKGSFMAEDKNYHMIPGGVALLGLLSLKDQLHFQPTGSSCGVMLYFSPLPNQGEPVFLLEGNHYSLSMKSDDVLIWEIQAGSKRLNDGNKEFAFKLYRAPSVSVSVGHNWRIVQFEGAFIVPSRISGIFHPPAGMTGYAFVSWGDAAPPGSGDKAAILDLKVIPEHNDTQVSHCKEFTPACLQAASDLAARQTAIFQYANVPVWLKMAAHALFPEHIQTESTHTQVTFAYPVALLPWNTKGLCAINGDSVLTLDNATLSEPLSDCYSVAVADCSQEADFAIFVRKKSRVTVAKAYCGMDEIELLPTEEGVSAYLNGKKVEVKQGHQPIEHEDSQLNIRMKRGGVIEVELRSGVVIQHYNSTIIILIPGKFRGYTCGLCGDFNGDTNNEPTIPYTKC